MADFDDIDALLSSSLKKAAEPANSAGVADLIRSRVAAGDPGTAVAGATAPGWKPPTPTWFWPLLGTVVGLAVVVAVLVAVVVWPTTPSPTNPPTATPTPTTSQTATASPTPTPTPTPTQTQEEEPPPPVRDTTAPEISAAQWSSGDVYPTGYNCSPTTADIVITATDETQLANVTAATSTTNTSAVFVGFSGSAYTFRFSGTTGGAGDTQVIVTFTAVDDAGNSASTSRPILFHNECIIIG